jgi:hypothetical protein
MTRFLSESLRAPEPYFRLHLRSLELAHGNPGTDINLTNKISLGVKRQIRQLNLDAHDTTPHELYLSLIIRLKADDARLTKTLRTLAATHISAEAEVVAGMAHALQGSAGLRDCFALKPSAGKKLIKALPPKKAMKALGYRSLESMLKQETLATIYAAASMSESPTWRRNLNERYKKLTPRDFEVRKLLIAHPNSKRWRDLAIENVAVQKHNLMSFPELGAIVLLPLPSHAPVGAVTASLALALQAMNQIQSSSTFLKLSQVKPDFGAMVRIVATDEPQLQATLLDKQVSWQLIHRYYARLQNFFQEELFEPHIRREDLGWHSVEQSMAKIEPSLKFWLGSAYLGVVHEGKAVSLNILDTALNACNGRTFEQRLTINFQDSLWHELQIRYLQPKTVEQTIMNELQPKLAFAPAIA